MSIKERILAAHLNPHELEVYKFILNEYTDGKVPTLKSISEAFKVNTKQNLEEILRKLQGNDLLTVKGEEIINAYPYSSIETPHKVIFEDNKEVYALCATDSIGIHFMTKNNIKIESICPQCGKKIKVQVKDGAISTGNGHEIIEFISYQNRGLNTAENLCPLLNFFCSIDHLKKWKKENPELKRGMVLNLQEALELSKKVFGDLI